MSINAYYYAMESPLNQELGSLIRIRKRDIPRDPVQGRMLVVLGSVLATLLLFAILMPAGDANVSNQDELLSPAGLANGGQNGEVVVAAPTLSPVFSPEVQVWRSSIERWAAAHSVDPDMVATIMQIESCGDPGALSHAGATGLFQVMPYHFDAGEDAWDPETNAHRGLAFFNTQLKHTGGDVYRAFAGYNGGYAASSSTWDHWAHETQRYYVWSKGIFDEAKAGLSASPTLQRWMEAGGSSLCQQAAGRLGLE